MKKVCLTIIILILQFGLFAQNNTAKSTTSVEKSTFGIQTGFLGVWVHNEVRLSNRIALRSEIGLDAGVYGGERENIEGVLFVPVLTLEPRWYYNIKKRQDKSKRIDGNSGNFISLKTSYHPDWFFISNQENINFISDIVIIPTWGIRRNLGVHFNYEAGFGLGYIHFLEEYNSIYAESDVAVNLHLRIGYRF